MNTFGASDSQEEIVFFAGEDFLQQGCNGKEDLHLLDACSWFFVFFALVFESGKYDCFADLINIQ